MPASFDGNDGNDGNSANSGGAGNATSTSAGWFFADRVNLPLATETDTGPKASGNIQIGALKIIAIKQFPNRNWSADWYSWLALNDFIATAWKTIDPTAIPGVPPSPINNAPIAMPAGGFWPAGVPKPAGFPAVPDWSTMALAPLVPDDEIKDLVTAVGERPDTLGEILSQSNEFASYFLNMMTARPGAYPGTTKVLAIASLVGTFVAMYYKDLYKRPRPSQLCPALLPPIEVPGHASFPSGHSTQGHLMALCLNDVLHGLPQQDTMNDDLWTLADRIARNREIAGLHYASDTDAGKAFAFWIQFYMNDTSQVHYAAAVTQARGEWT